MSLTLAPAQPEEPDNPTFYFGPDRVPLRAKLIDGDPWLVAADLARALDYRDASNALRSVDNEDVRTHQMSTNAGLRELMIVNESGFYAMIFRSEKPEAKAFKHWVTSEVLPAIRKTGQYGSLPQTYPEALRALAAAEEAKALAAQERDKAWGEATRIQLVADEQEQQIQRDAPKVGYVEHFVSPPVDAFTLGAIAAELEVPVSRLRVYLKEHKLIFRDSTGSWRAYSSDKGRAWFALRAHHEVLHRGPNGQVPTTLYVTPVGKEGIRRMLERAPIG